MLHFAQFSRTVRTPHLPTDFAGQGTAAGSQRDYRRDLGQKPEQGAGGAHAGAPAPVRAVGSGSRLRHPASLRSGRRDSCPVGDAAAADAGSARIAALRALSPDRKPHTVVDQAVEAAGQLARGAFRSWSMACCAITCGSRLPCWRPPMGT